MNRDATIRVSMLVVLSATLLCPVTRTFADEIRGTVMDDSGAPVAGAKVHAERTDVPSGGAVRFVETSSDGVFVLDQLEHGAYAVFASKESDGYPETAFAFYGVVARNRVQLSAAAPVATTVIHLEKAGRIHGVVRNRVNGKPLQAALTLKRLDYGYDLQTGIGPEFDILLPAATDVSVEVSAQGFKTWRHGGYGTAPPTPVNLASGAQMRMDVLLTPEKTQGVVYEIRFPERCRGWLKMQFGVKDAPPALQSDTSWRYEFPSCSELKTSSPAPADWSKVVHSTYSETGDVGAVPVNYWTGEGMIWGEYEISHVGAENGHGFFYGTEREYRQKKAARPE
jgi:Carboxypeptidase regulatory-like domain